MHDITFSDNRIRATVAIATFCPVGSVFYGMDGNLQARGSAPPQSCVYERIDPFLITAMRFNNSPAVRGLVHADHGTHRRRPKSHAIVDL
jgi:hypothetical protein